MLPGDLAVFSKIKRKNSVHDRLLIYQLGDRPPWKYGYHQKVIMKDDPMIVISVMNKPIIGWFDSKENHGTWCLVFGKNNIIGWELEFNLESINHV